MIRLNENSEVLKDDAALNYFEQNGPTRVKTVGASKAGQMLLATMHGVVVSCDKTTLTLESFEKIVLTRKYLSKVEFNIRELALEILVK